MMLIYLSKYFTLSENETKALKSSLGAKEIFNLKQITKDNPLCIPIKIFLRLYFVLFCKMFLISVLARIMAFGM